MNIMKKYFSSLLIAMTAFFSVFTLHAQQSKVIETISVFPYQHKVDADAALTSMATWKKSDWKGALKLLDDDSLKVKAADAIHAYTNLSAMDAGKKVQLLAYLNKGMKSAKTDYLACQR